MSISKELYEDIYSNIVILVGKNMKKLLLLICLSPMFSVAQQKGGYFSFAASAMFAKDRDPDFGAHLSGNGRLTKDLFLGAEIGFVKIQDIEGVYLPVMARVSLAPNLSKNKISPLILIQPGYGVYNRETLVGNFRIKQTGGFAFYGGLGVVFPSDKKGKVFMALGYSGLGFNTNEYKSRVETFAVRVGVMAF